MAGSIMTPKLCEISGACPECLGATGRLIAFLTNSHLSDKRLVVTNAAPVVVTCGRCGGEGTARSANLRDAMAAQP